MFAKEARSAEGYQLKVDADYLILPCKIYASMSSSEGLKCKMVEDDATL